MYYVYLIRSLNVSNQTYIGCTKDLKRRFAAHNTGESRHAAKFMPWRLVSYHASIAKDKAQAFERYLKTGSGQAFANKRFW